MMTFSFKLCEMETLLASNPVLRNSLSNSRMLIGMTYLNEQHLEILIEQLEQVRCTKIND